MLLNTKHFGEIEINEEKVVMFNEGLPGFESRKRFVLLQKEEGIFFWLQSIEDGDVAFLLLDTFSIMPEYTPNVNDDDLERIGGFELEHLLVYNIVVVPENVEETRVNLKAPVIIHTESKKGMQVIANNEEYGIRHYIFKELKKEEGAGEQ